MFKLFEPNKIFKITSKAPKYVLFLFIVVLSVGLVEALIISPEDYKQSDAVRIMYVHVPAAWISLGIFSSITLLSICGFVFRNKNFFLISKSLAPSGFVFNIIALVTGSIWGKPTWGTWWAWDARLTSMLILMLFYVFFIFSYKFIKDPIKSTKICTAISVLGLINLVIIRYSVNWWSTLHQSSSINITGKTTVHSSMLTPLVIMLIVFLLYSALIFLMKYRIETIRVKKKGLKKI